MVQDKRGVRGFTNRMSEAKPGEKKTDQMKRTITIKEHTSLICQLQKHSTEQILTARAQRAWSVLIVYGVNGNYVQMHASNTLVTVSVTIMTRLGVVVLGGHIYRQEIFKTDCGVDRTS